ncbi:MAG: TIR domain-containing protein [Isosphaerales bacterium]
MKLVRTLRGHTDTIGRIAWSPDGRMLASPSWDKTIRLWDVGTGECLRTLVGHTDQVWSVAFDPRGRNLASGSVDKTVKLWDAETGECLRTLVGHTDQVWNVAFDPRGRNLASGSRDATVKLWKTASGRLLRTMEGPKDAVSSVAFDPVGGNLASGDRDGRVRLWAAASGRLLHTLVGQHEQTIRLSLKAYDRDHGGRAIFPNSVPSVGRNLLCVAFDSAGRKLFGCGFGGGIAIWDMTSLRQLRTLEGHTGSAVNCVHSLADGRLLASKSGEDSTVRLWSSNTGACLAIIPEDAGRAFVPGLAFHPRLPLLATVGSDPGTPIDDRDRVIHIWELDLAVLLGQPAAPSVTYTSAKVVLVGDSGVGKTGLGWRLAHGEFKEHASTHGQQFWLLNQLCQKRSDGAQCEAVLWDLAGQPDYRLIHALFLDDADLALVLFDPTRDDDPLHGVEFWLKQLLVGVSAADRQRSPERRTPAILVAARSDRGTARLTQDEIEAYCKTRGLAGYLTTSAKEGEGVEELIQRMQALIPWDDKPATVTTETFKRIKDHVLDLKENRRRRKVILTPPELRRRLEKTDAKWKFTDAEMLTAAGHLANHGYVSWLNTSRGEPRILLAPELLNNLAASFVLEARRNPKGLGSLEEQRLLSGGYTFPELEKLAVIERDILLDSAAVLFLEHNICFRETDPLNTRAYLVFPELINLKRPLEEDATQVEDGIAYTVSGAVENVYASLVVLLGYTHTFTRTNQWRNHARYEVGNGLVCGFRLEAERDGELDFVLYFGTNADAPIRMLFQSLFESFLARRNLTVQRFEPVACSKGHPLDRAVVRKRLSVGAQFAFCNECAEKIVLPKFDKPIQLTKQQAAEVEADRRAADQRSRFEQMLFRLKTYVTEQKTTPPDCFISYAWGNPEQERWVEKSLATDLLKAGITVVLDRWENARIGASVPRFVERVGKCGRVIVVGTPLYQTKYENREPMRGYVSAAEGDLIGKRMIGTEARKESVLPVLLEGTEESAFPHFLHGRVYGDFRRSEAYFDTALDLILSLYEIQPRDPVAIELRESMRGLKV